MLRRAPGLCFLSILGVSGVTVGQTVSHRDTEDNTRQTGANHSLHAKRTGGESLK